MLFSLTILATIILPFLVVADATKMETILTGGPRVYEEGERYVEC